MKKRNRKTSYKKMTEREFPKGRGGKFRLFAQILRANKF